MCGTVSSDVPSVSGACPAPQRSPPGSSSPAPTTHRRSYAAVNPSDNHNQNYNIRKSVIGYNIHVQVNTFLTHIGSYLKVFMTFRLLIQRPWSRFVFRTKRHAGERSTERRSTKTSRDQGF